MARRKKIKFAENASLNNILEEGKPLYTQIKGQWHHLFFKNNNPITLELACGRGEYTTGMAKIFPDHNFIGVDLKGDRLWFGSTTAKINELNNVGFLRCHILDLEQFFSPEEVANIWIVHPDPRPKNKDDKRRLIHPRFLEIYQRLLPAGGYLRLKTDNRPLFNYALESLKEFPVVSLEKTVNLYESTLLADHHGIKTRYERKFNQMGHPINYLKCKFQGKPTVKESVVLSAKKDGVVFTALLQSALIEHRLFEKLEVEAKLMSEIIVDDCVYATEARHHDKPIGMCIARIDNDEHDKKKGCAKFTLLYFYVKIGYRNTGIGYGLIELLLDQLPKKPKSIELAEQNKIPAIQNIIAKIFL